MPNLAAGPRERLWVIGASALRDDELVALLIGTGRRGVPALALARELLGTGDPAHLLTQSPAQLARRSGIGMAKAARLLAAIELGRRALSAAPTRGDRLRSPAAVAALYGPRLAGLAEHFVVVHLDQRHRVLAETVAARGGSDRCPVAVREVLSAALSHGASAIVCVHNHPSGDVEPSPEDRELTRRLAQASALVGVTLLDHVIVAASDFCSLSERGLLPSPS
ncbi:MAG: DNA repair protein RadC [Deltaproteobacteria bacterium]|nr:DNA repair protein RadC [Deltaproteobacteria bacterium]